MEHLVHLIRTTSDFCDIKLLAYSVGPRQFEILLHAPKAHKLSDKEILHRYISYNGEESQTTLKLIRSLKHLKSGTRGKEERARSHKQFHDISRGLGLINQKLRFDIKSTKDELTHPQFWADRYHSMLVEDRPEIIAEAAAHVEALPIWEEITDDPSNYSFSSFGEACSSANPFRTAIKDFYQTTSWPWAKATHKRAILATPPPKRRWNMPRVFGNISSASVLKTKDKARARQGESSGRYTKRPFKDWLKELRAFKKQHVHVSVSSVDKEYRSLGRWLVRIRAKQRAGRLAEDQQIALEKLGVKWGPQPRGRGKRPS